jgi:hypothetical protein
MFAKWNSGMLALGLFAAGAVLHNEPASAASRAETSQRCNDLANRKAPWSSANAVRDRWLAYRVCMRRAGHRP